LSSEAIRLTRQLRESLPDEGRVAGLLALMLLTDAHPRRSDSPTGALHPARRGKTAAMETGPPSQKASRCIERR